MKDYTVVRNVVVETAEQSVRYVAGQVVSLKKAEADRLNKRASSPFLEELAATKTDDEGAS